MRYSPMRFLFYVLVPGVLLAGCGKAQEATKAETLQAQADIAKTRLQDKADALAQAAANATKKGNTGKPNKP